MAKASEFKRRIRSVENTRQITRTMEMVAASKLKKATDRVEASLPYSEAVAEVVAGLYDPSIADRFPLLREPEAPRRVAVVLFSANRGLAGPFTVNLIRETNRTLAHYEEAGAQVELHVYGKKGIAYYRFQGREMATSSTELPEAPTAEDAERIAAPFRDRFARGELDGFTVVASEFRSALTTPPRTREVLPIRGEERASGVENTILSPSREAILDHLLPLYVRNTVHRALVENVAAEQASRRAAMKNATDNAEEMLGDLQRSFNRARQAQITQEIAEIVGGAAAQE